MEENEAAPVGTPRWVKVFGIVALVVFVLIVVMLIAGRGGHGPGRHTGGGDQAHAAPPAGITRE